MAKVRVTSRWDIIDALAQDPDNLDEVGQTIVDSAKELIASGQSPVEGYGRFEGYSDSYKEGIKGSLGKEFGKNVRPVNMTLSGEMMDAYDYRPNRKSVTVGVMDDARSVEIAQYHQEGTDKMPQRKLTPGPGEEWAISIMRDIRDLYESWLEKIIGRTNK